MSAKFRFLDLPVECQILILQHCVPGFSISRYRDEWRLLIDGISAILTTATTGTLPLVSERSVAIRFPRVDRMLWIPRYLTDDLRRAFLAAYDGRLVCDTQFVTSDLDLEVSPHLPWGAITLIELVPGSSPVGWFTRGFDMYLKSITSILRNAHFRNLAIIRNSSEELLSYELSFLEEDSDGSSFMKGSLDKRICDWLDQRERISELPWTGRKKLRLELRMRIRGAYRRQNCWTFNFLVRGPRQISITNRDYEGACDSSMRLCNM